LDSQTILLVGLEPVAQTALRAGLRYARFAVLPGLSLDAKATQPPPSLAVVSIAENREAAFRLVSTLAAAGTRVVVVGPAKDADLILRAMREGAREYLVATDHDKLVQALQNQSQASGAAKLGTVVAVFPAKGGVGATSIATNLAGSLAKQGNRVCLVDLDLAMGDVLAFLDLSGGYAISDVIANMGRLDRDMLDASAARHRSGVHVYAQTERMEEAAGLEPQHLSSLIQFLRQHYRTVVVDGLRTLDEAAVAVLDACDQILLVTTQEVPAVRRAQRFVGLLRRLGHDGSRLRLVVNRHAKGAEVGSALITSNIGLPVSATISSDYAALIHAINRGRLLVEDAPNSPVLRDIAALEPLIGYRASEKPSLLKRLFAQKADHAP
jgi:pilus assembly protein CpaE